MVHLFFEADILIGFVVLPFYMKILVDILVLLFFDIKILADILIEFGVPLLFLKIAILVDILIEFLVLHFLEIAIFDWYLDWVFGSSFFGDCHFGWDFGWGCAFAYGFEPLLYEDLSKNPISSLSFLFSNSEHIKIHIQNLKRGWVPVDPPIIL